MAHAAGTATCATRHLTPTFARRSAPAPWESPEPTFQLSSCQFQPAKGHPPSPPKHHPNHLELLESFSILSLLRRRPSRLESAASFQNAKHDPEFRASLPHPRLPEPPPLRRRRRRQLALAPRAASTTNTTEGGRLLRRERRRRDGLLQFDAV